MQYALQYAASQAPPVLGIRQGEAHPFIPRTNVPRTMDHAANLRDYVVPDTIDFRTLEVSFPTAQSRPTNAHVCIS